MSTVASAVALATTIGLIGGALVGCSDTTEDEDVRFENPQGDGLEDDAPPPTPAYDESLTYESRGWGPRNNSTRRYRFDVAAFHDDAERAAAAALYPSHAEYFADHPDAVPSVQTIGTYVKQLDDMIYAGVEKAVQEGIEPSFAPKRKILEGALEVLLATRSADGDDAVVYVAAALRLGGGSAAVPADLETRVVEAMAAFSNDPLRAKPIGFYTWSDELRAIWAQDRFLQGPLRSAGAARALGLAIAGDEARRAAYEALLALYARLTNPLHSSLSHCLRDSDEDCAVPDVPAFLSSSKTSEVALFEQLYPNGVPANANLMQDLIAAIRNGAVDLTPKEDSGWYQYQSYALETMLVTDRSEERSKIAFTGKYKKRLQEAFSTMLVQHRETHVKQADVAVPVSDVRPDVPDFRLEPLATVYVRHARSYVFLEKALDDAYGPDLLDRGVPVTEQATERRTLREQVHKARDLFFGLYLTAAYDIGMKPALGRAGDPEASTWKTLADSADDWLKNLATDVIARKDVRVIVPIAQIDSTHVRYWAVIGVRTTLASYSYIEGDTMKAPALEDEARVPLATEQFLEVTSSAVPPTRDEFRALCDAKQTAEAIQAALEQR